MTATTTTTSSSIVDVRDIKLMDATGYFIKNLLHKAIRVTNQTDIILDISEDTLVTVRSHTSTMRNDAETDQALTLSNNERLLLEAEAALNATKAA